MNRPISILDRRSRPALRALLLLFGLQLLVGPSGCAPQEPPRPAARDDLAIGSAADLPGGSGSDEIRVEPWSFGDYQGDLIVTPTHLLHTTIPEGSLREGLPVFTEAALEHYRRLIPPRDPSEAPATSEGMLDDRLANDGPLPAPTERMSTFLFDTRPQWAAWTTRRLGRDARTYLAIERGGYTIDAESVLWDIGRYDTRCMLAHEGWHQYTQTVFRHPLPTFLEEGLAAYAEGHSFRRSDERPRFMPWRNLERYGQLRGANYRDRLIDLDELVTLPPQAFVSRGERSLLTYYAQVWVLIHYLVEGEGGRYRAGLRRLLDDAAAGHIATSLYDADRSAGRRGRLLGPNAGRAIIAVYFDRDYPRFKAGYEDFIRRVVARGNGTKIWQGVSPLSAD